ncbi:unnamed protein product [Nesidiocoris tenuis]|uniref:Amino acid transporter transmembrane domain-containing protein n=1 Tax=Nesidiocoris tenuis TaxID=355587 RepID=A0A6H5FU81_9HEMI|nr:unnamed protein product [Nesidiocoris tenuis]
MAESGLAGRRIFERPDHDDPLCGAILVSATYSLETLRNFPYCSRDCVASKYFVRYSRVLRLIKKHHMFELFSLVTGDFRSIVINRAQQLDACIQRVESCVEKMDRLSVKVFIVVTQLGFCCVYFVFVSSTAQTVLKSFDIDYDVKIYMAIMFVPVLLTCLIRSLKFLTPISLLSNTCLLSGIVFTLYLSCSDFPPISERRLYSTLDTLPLFFGTIIYSFEGIALVIPLKNEMKEQSKFAKPLGVLNIGMGIIMSILISMGTIGYWKYGDAVEGSLSLNLDKAHVSSQIVQTVVGVGIMFSYALQMYVAAELLWDEIEGTYGPFKHPVVLELVLRCILVFITFILAASIPALGLFISLVGAVSSSALALVYPAMSDIALRTCPEAEGPLRTKDQFFRWAFRSN